MFDLLTLLIIIIVLELGAVVNRLQQLVNLTRENSEVERLLNDRIRVTTEDLRAVSALQRDVMADAVIAADARGRAEGPRRSVAREDCQM